MTLLDQLKNEGATRLYIAGEWRESSDGAQIGVLDPATELELAEVSSGSVDDAIASIDAAEVAAEAFASTSPLERSEILRRAFELMVASADELAGLIVAEMGKSFGEARGEVLYAAEFFRWYSGEAVRNIGYVNKAPAGDKRIIAINQPIGISLLITPWNFPAAMATRKIGPAVAAGCTMVLKPASDTPLTALAIGQILTRAGLPNGVLNILPSQRSSAVVTAMLKDERVRNLSFTGSTEVGRALLAQAAERVVRCSMELGGNAPFLVFEDADIEAAVSGTMVAKMRNIGQSCVAANRIYVHAAVVDDYTNQLSEAMSALTLGPGMRDGIDLGPVINERATDDLSGLVAESTGHGSQVRIGGRRPDREGFFFEPTVLSGVSHDNPILAKEIFGPVAPIVTFESEEEALTLANDTIYGLAAYLYTGDLGRGMRVAEGLDAGMVAVNRGIMSDPAAPFGGVKQSGQGREGSHEGLMEFLETKYIAADW
ncbi:MAG: NAD-dependent succinate-semialdehyde dehydrogenase [Acidimicrobiia bacterium]